MKFVVNQEVFKVFPNLIVKIPVVIGFRNVVGEQNKEEIVKYVKKQENNLRERFHNQEELLNYEFIKVYIDAFRKFGADTKEVLPTHLSLAKRVLA